LSTSSKASISEFVEIVWNAGQTERVYDLVAADYVGHGPAGVEPIVGPEGLRRFVMRCREALADLHVQINDQLAEEDRVAVRWIAAGSGGGPGATALRTDGHVQYRGISIVRLLAGKQVESHTEFHLVPADAKT